MPDPVLLNVAAEFGVRNPLRVYESGSLFESEPVSFTTTVLLAFTIIVQSSVFKSEYS